MPRGIAQYRSEVLGLLNRVLGRLQARAVMRALGWGVLAGGLLLACGTLFSFLARVPNTLFFMPCIGLGLAVAVGLFLGSRKTMTAAADLVDRHLGLKERMISALEFSGLNDPQPLHVWQMEDTSERIRDASSAVIVPWEWRRNAGPFLVGIVLFAVIGSVGPVGLDAQAHVPPAPAAVMGESEELLSTLEELLAMEEELSEEVSAMLEQLRETASRMQEPGTNMEEALEILGKMRNQVQRSAAELNTAVTERMMQSMAELLKTSSATASIGESLSRADYEQAAKDMDALAQSMDEKAPSMFKDAASMDQGLRDLAAKMSQAGLKNWSREVEGLRQAMKSSDQSACKRCMGKMSSQCRSLALQKRMSALMNRQLRQLASCRQNLNKGYCRSCMGSGQCQGGQCRGRGIGRSLVQQLKFEKSDNPSQKAGTAVHANPYGAETELDADRTMEALSGEMTAGTSEFEIELGADEQQTAARGYREVYSRYKKMSDQALASEPIPPGYRYTIKRYFESIRPQREDLGE